MSERRDPVPETARYYLRHSNDDQAYTMAERLCAAHNAFNHLENAAFHEAEVVDHLTKRIAELRAEIIMHRDKAKGDYWAWQGDGNDLESLVCPVLIHPHDLRQIIMPKAVTVLRWVKQEDHYGVGWRLKRHDGTEAARVYGNGVWYTTDQHGHDGQNSSCKDTADAKSIAMAAAIEQGFIDGINVAE